ncbi:MAG: alpha-L-rhamnosidase, partial [Bacteroidaceae bacterium]|nr:alpha-L-rhamnosidase [Bacteroidaceae bacterium]
DIHGDFGGYCYVGFRHSLCHGWASGPTAWMSHHILGVEVVEPGCKKVRITPHLGNLQWVEGTYPTPSGEVIRIKHVKQPDGKIKTTVKAPKGVKIIK